MTGRAQLPRLPPETWFTTSEAARYLKRSASAVRTLIHRGQLIPDGRGPRGTHMFRLLTLDRFLEAGARYAPGRHATPGERVNDEKQGKEDSVSGHSIAGRGALSVHLKWRDPKTGRTKEVDRTFEGLATPAEANGRREELRAQLEAGELENRARMRVKDYARSWLSTKLPTLKPSTASRYASALDLHVLPHLGEMYVDAVERGDVILMRDALGERLKPATVNGALRVLRTMFGDAELELDLLPNPTMRVEALTDRVVDEDPNCLSGEQLARLLDATHKVSPQHYPLFRTLAETGMRISEATSLRWDDVDERRGIILIRRWHWRGQVGTTKTNRTRTVPMTPGLAAVLADHRRDMLEAQAPGLADGWVFPSKAGTLMSHVTLQKPLKAALAAAGISERFTLHGFRRTFNNLLRQATTGEVVRSMTGHVTERMTEHYSHVETAEMQRAVLRALPAFEAHSPTQSGDQVGSRWGPRVQQRKRRSAHLS